MKTADFQLVHALRREVQPGSPGASPFKIVIDPQMRLQLRRALIERSIITTNPWRLIIPAAELALRSYKGGIRGQRAEPEERWRAGRRLPFVRAVGFNVPSEEVNLRQIAFKPGGLA
jgi:hypothetical protein